MSNAFADELIRAANQLSHELAQIDFSAVTKWVYNPFEYAAAAYQQYVQQCAAKPLRYVMLGMNPGPWGMAQTGIPFGEVNVVRDWLKIDATIAKPLAQHPKRQIVGLDCKRSEVSGARLWGLMQARYKKASGFFREALVVNYCPLVFMDEAGRNLTPDKFPKAIRAAIQVPCDDHLRRTLEILQPKFVVGVGNYAFDIAANVVFDRPSLGKMQIVKILHPSPASPAANRDWAGQTTAALVAAGIWK